MADNFGGRGDAIPARLGREGRALCEVRGDPRRVRGLDEPQAAPEPLASDLVTGREQPGLRPAYRPAPAEVAAGEAPAVQRQPADQRVEPQTGPAARNPRVRQRPPVPTWIRCG